MTARITLPCRGIHEARELAFTMGAALTEGHTAKAINAGAGWTVEITFERVPPPVGLYASGREACAKALRRCPTCGGSHPVGCCAKDGHG